MAATCAFAAPTATVTLVANDTAVVSVSGSAVRLNAANCSTATVFNTDTIRVVGAGGNEQLTLDLAGGQFAPGATAEASELLEIELEVDLGAGASDRLVVSGTSGADSFVLGANGINLNGDDDADVTALAGAELFTTSGGAGDDTLSAAGGAGTGGPFPHAATLNGESGNDALVSRPAHDALLGGLGTDTVDYSGVPAGVTVDLAAVGAQNTGGGGTDTLSGFENVSGSAFADAISGDGAVNGLAGGDGADVLTGAGANDVLTGADGDDMLAGLGGNDTLDGGEGSDTADYAAAPAGVTVNLTTAASSGAAGADALVAVENVIGSGFGDTLTANAVDNALSGRGGTDAVDYSTASAAVSIDLQAGIVSGASGDDRVAEIENATGSAFNDALTGSGGANVLTGGSGLDVIAGGPGDDMLDGGAGLDTAAYARAAGPVSVNLTTLAAGGADGGDTLTGFEGATGSPFADVLIGDTGANVLNGEGGDDVLRGLGGNDALAGGAGNDAVDYSSHAPVSLRVGVTVDLQRGVASGEGFDLVSEVEDVVGSAFEDTLVGDGAPNGLNGGRGADTIAGGAGRDVLVGGPGADDMDGGVGGDLLLARDGRADRVRGGAGVDRGRVDRADRVRSLERRSASGRAR